MPSIRIRTGLNAIMNIRVHLFADLLVFLFTLFILTFRMSFLGGDHHPIRVATYNCRSVKTSMADIKSLCDNHDLVFLQETWLMPHEVTFLNSIHGEFHVFGNSAVRTSDGLLVGRPYGGLAVLWRKDLGHCITVIDYDDARLLGVTIKGPDMVSFILNVYMPTADHGNHDIIHDYLGKIQSIIREAGHSHVIVLGDWNARPGRIEFEWLHELCGDLDLVVSDLSQLPEDTFTYISDAHGTLSWIDHVLMSASVHVCCRDMSVLYDHIISDHRPISFRVDLGDLPRLVAEDGQPPVTAKVPWGKLSNADLCGYQERVTRLLDDIVLPTDALLCGECDHLSHQSDLSNYYDLINRALLRASECFLVSGRRDHHAVPGWNDMVAEAHSEARNNFLFWAAAGKPRFGPIHQVMSTSRARFKYALRACRANAERWQAEGLARSLVGHEFREFWSRVQRKSGSDQVSTVIDGHTGNQNITDFWRSHYQSLLNSVSRPDHSSSLNERLNSVRDDRIVVWSVEDLSKYRSQIKLGKSAGMDGLTPEHLRYAPGKIDIHLALIFNSLVCHSFLPHSFMPVRIVPIVKCVTGDLSSSNNYRPVAIATAISKVLEMAILDKVEEIWEIPLQNQFGFRKGSSTDQCIFLLKERIRRYVQLGGPVYCGFLDASKAFDRVCHSTLFLQLVDHGIPLCIVRLLAFWYSEQTMFVSWNNCTSVGFTTGNGVRQGSILSPALFNIYVNNFSVKLNDLDVGCFLNEVSINHLIYADDICLISPSLAGLRKLLRVCESVGESLSIKFNTDKSVCMCFIPSGYHELPIYDVKLNGLPLTFVSETKYLGHIISSDLSDRLDLEKTRRAIYARGNTLVRRFGCCSENVKIVLFRSYVTPLYCSHIWANYTQQQFRSVKVAYNCIFRKLFGIPRTESARMNLVRRSLPTIHEIIRINTRSLFERLSCSLNPVSNDVNHLVTLTSYIGRTYLPRFLQ